MPQSSDPLAGEVAEVCVRPLKAHWSAAAGDDAVMCMAGACRLLSPLEGRAGQMAHRQGDS